MKWQNQYVSSVLPLRRQRQVRRLFGRDVTANLVSAFTPSRLDYCNAVLARLPYATIAVIAPLQRAVNAAVRLVYGLYVHVTMFQQQRSNYIGCQLSTHTSSSYASSSI